MRISNCHTIFFSEVRTAYVLGVLTALLCSCKNPLKPPQFSLLPAGETGITFTNTVKETEQLNPIDYLNMYNGGGIAAGDFNNDGKLDVYFTGNEASNTLYLNQGDWKFSNTTQVSGVGGQGRWCQGVAVVDINNDAKLDLYVCAGLLDAPKKRTNLLYVNQGNNAQGVPLFKDMAREYGLADTTSTTNAAFFDYDNDGDLDVYLLVDEVIPAVPTNIYWKKTNDGSALNNDRLYRNDGVPDGETGGFTDVTREAGILAEGYGLGVNICDINEDGWKDVYVSNDFTTNDLFWINNRNGTFTDRADELFRHTSFTAMGNDVVDLNNDGLDDIVTLDMMGEDNFRRKQMDRAYVYTHYELYDRLGYTHQYKRNTLQVNLGRKPGEEQPLPLFSEISFQAGIAYTDWSWTPLCFDADQDGFRDLIVTNGYYRDSGDSDFMVYQSGEKSGLSHYQLTQKMPMVKIRNYAYRNRALSEKGALGFEDVSAAWGVNQPSFSHSAAYGDFDNDGDLDFMVNNLNEPAFVYRNNQDAPNYLRVVLKGPAGNRYGIGAKVEMVADQLTQAYAMNPYRGYLSCQEPVAHFGLGAAEKIDQVTVTWPDGKRQTLQNQRGGQTLVLDYGQAKTILAPSVQDEKTVLTDITAQSGIAYADKDEDFNDFNFQKLLLYKYSQNGPRMTTGDVNGDGLEDVFISAPKGHQGVFFLQTSTGQFTQADLLPVGEGKEEDADCLLLDADNDTDLDLLIINDGYEQIPFNPFVPPQLFLNDGKGHFTESQPTGMEAVKTSGGCVKAHDFDGDGDLDLFIGGRVKPSYVPTPVSSYVLRNDSRPGRVRFVDASSQIAPQLKEIGMVCDMTWTDLNGDGQVDMLLAGEFMPLTYLQQDQGLFTIQSLGETIDAKKGLWRYLASSDLDGDGDPDYVAGNLGQNTLVQPTANQPLKVYYGDLNKDGMPDAIPTAYFRINLDRYDRQEYPLFSRDDMNKQMIQFRRQATSYKQFSQASAEELLKEYPDKKTVEANFAASVWLENRGKGKLVLHELPAMAQYSVVNSIVTDDFDRDGRQDVLLCGNDYGNELISGRMDASFGVLLRNRGSAGFEPLRPSESGFMASGDARDLVRVHSRAGPKLLIVSRNRGGLSVFRY